MAQYYYLLFALTALLFVPMLWMREIEDRGPSRTMGQFAHDIFDTCRNLTTSYLLVFVAGTTMLALSPFNGAWRGWVGVCVGGGGRKFRFGSRA
jgi:hypothetical protein